MSFNADPFATVTIAYSRTGDAVGWECDSCGCVQTETKYTKERYRSVTAIGDLIVDFQKHVMDSHKLFPHDTEMWSRSIQ